MVLTTAVLRFFYSITRPGWIRTSMSIDTTTETAIFERIVLLGEPALSKEAARSVMALSFSPGDLERMQELAEKARAGTLTADEERAIANYERVGHYLAILRSKARMTLRPEADSTS